MSKIANRVGDFVFAAAVKKATHNKKKYSIGGRSACDGTYTTSEVSESVRVYLVRARIGLGQCLTMLMLMMVVML